MNAFVNVVRAQDREDDDQHDQAEDGRQRADVAAADLRYSVQAARSRLGAALVPAPALGAGRRHWRLRCVMPSPLAVDAAPSSLGVAGLAGAARASPERPVVISSTTCCW